MPAIAKSPSRAAIAGAGGQRIAVNQRRHVVNDWNQLGLRAPPRGHRWVRESNNSGDYLLIVAATGLIASILSQ